MDPGISKSNNDDITHFQDSLKDHFHFHMEWEGANYIRIKLDWHYIADFVNISMPTYIDKTFKSK